MPSGGWRLIYAVAMIMMSASAYRTPKCNRGCCTAGYWMQGLGGLGFWLVVGTGRNHEYVDESNHGGPFIDRVIGDE